jgi:hypothetical protein
MGWIYLVLTILFGLFLYWLRCRHRVLYGAAEIVVALLLIYTFFFPEHRGAHGSPRFERLLALR